MDNEEQESGMSLGSIFRIIFSQKWIVLIILVAVTLAGTLGIYLGKNKITETYDVSFTLELPKTGNDESVIYYPDGTPFYYADIVSLSTLRKVKSSEAFKDMNINVDKMSKNGDISISRDIYETADNSGVYETIYNLSIKASYFHGNKDAARNFMVALTNMPIDYMRSMNIDYNVYINSAKDAPDYVTEISRLISQANYLIGRYDTFVELYNDLSIDSGDGKSKTLRAYSQEIRSYLDDSGELEILLAEARKNAYLKSEDLKNKYRTELYKLERQQRIARETLKNLLTAKGDSEVVSVSSAAIIKSQADLVAELDVKIDEIKGTDVSKEYRYIGYINSTDYEGGDFTENHKNFKTALLEEYEQIRKYTEEFKVVVSELYGKVAVVSYSNSDVVVTSGVTGLIMSFVISLIVGLLIAMIVAFVVGWLKIKKAEKAAAPEQLQIEYKQSE